MICVGKLSVPLFSSTQMTCPESAIDEQDTESTKSPLGPFINNTKVTGQDALGVKYDLVKKSSIEDCHDMTIHVVVRKRPLSADENNRGEKDVLNIGARGEVVVNEPKLKVDLSKVYSYLHILWIKNDY